MIKVVMLLVYLMGGEIKIERETFATPEACDKRATARVAEIAANPHFDQGIAAVCTWAKVTEA